MQDTAKHAFAATFVLSASSLVAQFQPFGQGCNSPTRPLRLYLERGEQAVAGDRPIRFRADSLPGSVPATLLLGFSRYPSPLDLAPLGAPGCSLYVFGDVGLPMGRSGAQAVADLAPLGFRCGDLYAQCVSLYPAANSLGVVTSNAATLTFDAQLDARAHSVTPANSSNNYTWLDEALAGGEPGGLLFGNQVLPSSNPALNPHEIGVFYHRGLQRWAYFNQDLAPMPNTARFVTVMPNSAAAQFTHTVSASTRPPGSSVHRSVLRHERLDDNPAAKVFVTGVWNPQDRSAGIYNRHPVGVWFNAVSRHWEVFNEDLGALTDGASFNVLVADPDLASPEPAFTMVADGGWINGNTALLDHVALNGNPFAAVLVTQNYTPRGVYNPHPIAIQFNGAANRWQVVNQDGAPMPQGVAFNVLIAGSQPRAASWSHVTDLFNLDRHVSRLERAELNARPDNIPFVTQVWNAGGTGSSQNPYHTGVYYATSWNRWAVFNQGRDVMQSNAAFHVFVPNSAATTFIARATTGNTIGNTLPLDHPSLNGNAAARVFVQQVWGQGGTLGTYNNRQIGVFYDGRKWRIFNQDIRPLDAGVTFQVLVADDRLGTVSPAFKHRATALNSTSSGTELDHPALNGNPDARLIVTPHYGTTHVYDTHPVAVRYQSGRWRIVHGDSSSMVLGTEFNVLIADGCD